MALLHYYLTLLSSDQGQPSKAGSILKHVLLTPLGMSFLLGLIQKFTFLHQQQPNADMSKSRNLLLNLGKRIHDEYKNEKFCPPVVPLSVELPCQLFNNKDLDSESFQQLQNLVNAGLQEAE